MLGQAGSKQWQIGVSETRQGKEHEDKAQIGKNSNAFRFYQILHATHVPTHKITTCQGTSHPPGCCP